MTESIRIVERMRWITAGGAALAAILSVSIALLAGNAQSTALQLAPSASAGGPAALVGSRSSLDPRITKLAAHHPGALVETIVQFKAGVSLERSRWAVARAQGQVFGALQIINALAVKLTAVHARQLAANPAVHAVSLNAEVTAQGGPGGPGGPGRPGRAGSYPQNTYDQTLDVPALWRSGLTGSGVGVAVIDTGIDGGLPDFQSSNGSGSRVVESAVTNPGATNAIDDYGHGTDVAGIIAGDGNNLSHSNPLRGDYIGVAPHANLISIKVSNDGGSASVLNVLYGLQFAVDHQSDFNIRVINMSLDSDTPQSYTTDPLDAAVESAWMHGIVVVVAAGNRGNTPDAVNFAPANDPYVITVGAADEHGSSDAAGDTIAPWSSQGTTQDGFQKPDVYAPGVHIASVLAPNSVFANTCSACIVGGRYIRTSGTSMATPMISGLAALVLEAHPNWTPDQVKAALTTPGVASSPGIQEPDAAEVAALGAPAPADAGLTPNDLVDPSTGDINYSQSSWSQSSWSQANGPLTASFAQSSWSCACGQSSTGAVGPSTSSWSTSSWSTYIDPSPAG